MPPWRAEPRNRAAGRRGLAFLLGALSALGAVGCPTGDGDGEVVGRFYVLGCDGAFNYGARDAPASYDMGADFFVGEPILDETELNPRHRLDLRIQRGGNTMEDTDSLYIQVRDVAAVAERFATGQPIPVGPDVQVSAALLLYVTCPTFFGALEAAPPHEPGVATCPTVSATEVQALCESTDFNESVDPDAPFPPFEDHHSCLILCRFGEAEWGQPTPDSFKVDFGDVVAGIFSLRVTDQRLRQQGLEICADGVDNDGDGDTDEGDCELSPGRGMLRGTFNFEVRRGQVAQEFP